MVSQSHSLHHPFSGEVPEAAGIDKTFVGVHASIYTNLNTQKRKKPLLLPPNSHCLAKIHLLDLQRSQEKKPLVAPALVNDAEQKQRFNSNSSFGGRMEF
jgi:hypothetical protein